MSLPVSLHDRYCELSCVDYCVQLVLQILSDSIVLNFSSHWCSSFLSYSLSTLELVLVRGLVSDLEIMVIYPKGEVQFPLCSSIGLLLFLIVVAVLRWCCSLLLVLLG
ncbi:hypothetical protein Dimus_032459 [Dionaea muscipula]